MHNFSLQVHEKSIKFAGCRYFLHLFTTSSKGSPIDLVIKDKSILYQRH